VRLFAGVLALLALLAAASAAQAQISVAQAQGLDIAGRAVPGGLLVISVPAGDRGLTVDGVALVPVEPGRYLFGVKRDAKGALTLKTAGGISQQLALEPRSYRIQNLPALGVTDTPAPEWVERREREVAIMLGGKWAAAGGISERAGWKEAFARPVAGRETGVYGSQRVYGGLPRSPHWGLDIAAPIGRPVKAPASGIVRVAAGPLLLEGNVVMLDHGGGLVTTYLHLDRIDVKVGDKVARGAVLGTVGTTGRSTGPHLHWGMSLVRPGVGGKLDEVRLDPKLMLK